MHQNWCIVQLRQQFDHKTEYDGISAFAWGYDKVNSSYYVVPNYIKRLGEKDPDLEKTPFEDYFVKLKADDVIEYPVTLDSIMDFEAVGDYEVIEESENTSKNVFVEGNEKIDISKIDLHLTYHLEAQPMSDMRDDVKEDIAGMHSSRVAYAKELVKGISEKYNSKSSEIREVLISIRDSFKKLSQIRCTKTGASFNQTKFNQTMTTAYFHLSQEVSSRNQQAYHYL